MIDLENCLMNLFKKKEDKFNNEGIFIDFKSKLKTDLSKSLLFFGINTFDGQDKIISTVSAVPTEVD